MDLKSTAAQTTTLAQNAAKSALHAAWTNVATHPRTATVTALALILISGVVGFAVGAGL